MSETRKLAAILGAEYSRLAGADEDRKLARLRALRSGLIDPTITVHNRCVVKRTGDGSLGVIFSFSKGNSALEADSRVLWVASRT
jgi:class 3 adenylate cyclase